MSLKGGYQIVDLKLKDFNSTLQNVFIFPELYNEIVNSHAKMIIISGLNLDGVKYNDFEVVFYETNIDGENCYQAILRKNWDTKNSVVTTKYITIYPNDVVKTTSDAENWSNSKFSTIYSDSTSMNVDGTTTNSHVTISKINSILMIEIQSVGVNSTISSISINLPDIIEKNYLNFNGKKYSIIDTFTNGFRFDIRDVFYDTLRTTITASIHNKTITINLNNLAETATSFSEGDGLRLIGICYEV